MVSLTFCLCVSWGAGDHHHHQRLAGGFVAVGRFETGGGRGGGVYALYTLRAARLFAGGVVTTQHKLL